MYVGHYAASLALKRFEKRASLGVLFLAVQLVDIIFFPLVLLGVERLNIVRPLEQRSRDLRSRGNPVARWPLVVFASDQGLDQDG